MLRWALEAALVTLGTAFLMLIAVVFLRLRLLARRRREQRFLATWRPLMVQCVEAVPASLPRVGRADRALFLQLWNHYQDSLRGDAGERLNELAARTGMDAVARSMLAQRSLRERLIAIVTLGHLADAGSLDALRRLARDEASLVSLAAAHAVLRIDPGTLSWIIAESARRRPGQASRARGRSCRRGSRFGRAPPAAPRRSVLCRAPRRRSPAHGRARAGSLAAGGLPQRAAGSA